jgi:SAM-dependent methyltransferase
MSQTFGPLYADIYDPLYHDKKYAAECDLIEEIFRRYGTNGVSKMLDMGSGTGNHAFLMSSRGYQVVGVERSESMLRIAQSKLVRLHEQTGLRFCQGDIRNVELHDQFDAALMMFAVLGYQLENSDVLSALRTTRRHLQPGGLFIFDIWYGPAVLHEGPSQRVKLIPADGRKVLRAASSELDVSRHLCRVDYHLWSFAGTSLNGETEETHLMRYFFPLELQLFMECAGFKLIRLGAFPDFDNEPDFTTWNVLGVARAI